MVRSIAKVPSESKSGALHGRKTVRATEAGALRAVAADVLRKAEAAGLLDEKDSRITGRVSKALVEQAKRRTGIRENTQLIEYALANLALEDNFAAAFKSVKGSVDSDIDLGL